MSSRRRSGQSKKGQDDHAEQEKVSLESTREQKLLTESELLFEEYLTSHGYTDWWRIPESKDKQPHYGVRYEHSEAVFEVKEFDGDAPPLGFGTFDAYGPDTTGPRSGIE